MVVRCSCGALGALQLAAVWWMKLEREREVLVDSSATLRMNRRTLDDKMRHAGVGQL